MAIYPSEFKSKYEFEYDVGQWTFGSISVMRHRETDSLRTVRTVPKALWFNTHGDGFNKLKALKNLQHQHICSIADVLEDQQNFYIVTEFVQGGEISDWLERLMEGYIVQEQTCAAYIRQALIAMVHCHSAQVYHGALLPSSLVLSSKMPDAFVKVADFGLAAVLDPDNVIAIRNQSPYTAPEVLSGEVTFADFAADAYSIGAIAHALLVGRAPNQVGDGSPFCLQLGGSNFEAAWADRSALSRDFVRQLLKPWDERASPARALQHPWLKGLQPIAGVISDSTAEKEMSKKTLCYMLAMLMVPVGMPVRDFDHLSSALTQSDTDGDGLVPRFLARRILYGRCSTRQAVDAAIAIVDVDGGDVLDLGALACADLIAREYFAAGPTGQPLTGPFGAADLAPRMLKRFFDIFGGKQHLVTLDGIRTKLRTATCQQVERQVGVRYDEVLADFPEKANIDAQMLLSLLAAGAGHGTPLGSDHTVMSTEDSQIWPVDAFTNGFQLLMSQCGVAHGRRDQVVAQ